MGSWLWNRGHRPPRLTLLFYSFNKVNLKAKTITSHLGLWLIVILIKKSTNFIYHWTPFVESSSVLRTPYSRFQCFLLTEPGTNPEICTRLPSPKRSLLYYDFLHQEIPFETQTSCLQIKSKCSWRVYGHNDITHFGTNFDSPSVYTEELQGRSDHSRGRLCSFGVLFLNPYWELESYVVPLNLFDEESPNISFYRSEIETGRL